MQNIFSVCIDTTILLRYNSVMEVIRVFSINERFREIFDESKLSQEKFAKKIKRGRGEVANIIYDKVAPKTEIIEAVCEEFDYRVEWLRDGELPKKIKRSKEDEIAELVGSALTGSSEFKKAVIRMICSRTEEELANLEAALRAIYENLGNEKNQGN